MTKQTASAQAAALGETSYRSRLREWETRQYDELVSQAAASAWIWLMRNPGRRAYLYIEPAAGSRWARLYFVPEGETDQQPPGLEPLDPQTIPADTEPRIRQWIQARTDRVPVYGIDPATHAVTARTAADEKTRPRRPGDDPRPAARRKDRQQ